MLATLAASVSINFKQTTPFVIAGPCSAETREQVLAVAEGISGGHVHMMRAGVWKPRTKPGGFEGVGALALPWLQEAKQMSGLPICIEVATPQQIELALQHNIDCLWLGARTTVSPFVVQELAEVLRGTKLPIMVKNPVNPDVDLWQGAIERLYACGIENIAAIHRGFSTYDKASKYRNKPMWSLPIELRRRMPDLPIICDPSHITGNRELVAMVSQRAMDLHFDGLMIETHINPEAAWSDAAQQITPAVLKELLSNLRLAKPDLASNDAQLMLEDLRQQVDSLDAELVDIIARRMRIVQGIADVKKADNISVYQPDRWQQIINLRSAQGQKLDLEEAFILKLFEVIHDKSIRTQFKRMAE
ncbi:MAG: hypothetical protein RL660_2067 [Bacteroidota bacterium]